MTQRTGLIPTEQARRTANGVLIGTVAEIDAAAARVRVQSGDNISDWLPWLTQRAGGDRSWSAPDIGEQVIVAAPDGDLARGVVLGAIYQTAHPAPAASVDVQRTVYQDGAVVEYDRAAHKLTATLPAGGTAELTAPAGTTVNADGGVTVNAATGGVVIDATTGNVTITGDLLVTGNIAVTGTGNNMSIANGNMSLANGNITVTGGDVTAGSISLKTHVHSGVTPGGSNTGLPV